MAYHIYIYIMVYNVTIQVQYLYGMEYTVRLQYKV